MLPEIMMNFQVLSSVLDGCDKSFNVHVHEAWTCLKARPHIYFGSHNASLYVWVSDIYLESRDEAHVGLRCPTHMALEINKYGKPRECTQVSLVSSSTPVPWLASAQAIISIFINHALSTNPPCPCDTP
jgi:hypothetical protein